MQPRLARAARFGLLGGLTTGLGLSPHLPIGPPGPDAIAGALAALAALALAARAIRTDGMLVAWLAPVALLAAAVGLALGSARVRAIERGAYAGDADKAVAVRGYVAAVPRRADGEVRARIDTADGRLALEAREPVGELPVGREVVARGVVREPEAWEASYLERLGIARVVEARRVRLTSRRRGGIAYPIDRVRERAQAALGRGTSESAASLLRGFVLGEDDRIDPATVEDFQRSGLAHLLAVSGQNVLLLAILGGAVLALLGVSVRVRLACLLALIALYVPVAGAGPSIQRAGVMGAAATVAAMAGRPASRWYALLLAAVATLALSPYASADMGWQLSFAAVIGIALWTAPLREALAGGAERRPGGTSVRLVLSEAAAVTVAATLATAPLMAHHFDRLSLAALPANLIALPAVAPVMWLGMLAAAAGQLPWLPVEPLTALAGVLAGYIAQVADWLSAPGWAQVTAPLSEPTAVACVYSLMITGGWLAGGRRGLRRGLRTRAGAATVGVTLAGLALAIGLWSSGPDGASGPPPGLRVRALDVGQGDAILLQPRHALPILVDAGPPGAGAAARLAELRVDRLGALVLTHGDSDHAGGVDEVLAHQEVEAVAYGSRSAGLRAAAHTEGAARLRLAAGRVLRVGGLRLTVLWPPDVGLRSPADEPNTRSVVLLARWRHFRMLLTGDGEAEAVPMDPGPVDLLKVAHHGSADEGLDRLLDRTGPDAAVISVGANPYGHPAPETIEALAEHGVRTLRTDLEGEVVVEVTSEGWTAGGVE